MSVSSYCVIDWLSCRYIYFFLQTRMAVFSVRRAKPSMGRKQAHSLLGRWSTTSSPTAYPATQTPRPSASSMTFLPVSRSGPYHFTKSTMLLLCLDPLSLPSKSVPFLQLLLIRLSLTVGCWCRKVRCCGCVSHWGNSFLRDHTVGLGRNRLQNPKREILSLY